MGCGEWRGGILREGVLESVGKLGGVNGGVGLVFFWGGQFIPCKVFCVGSRRIQNRERGTGTEIGNTGETRKTNAKGSYVEGRVCVYAVFVFDISPSCFLLMKAVDQWVPLLVCFLMARPDDDGCSGLMITNGACSMD